MELERMYKRLILALALVIPASAFGFTSKNAAVDVRGAFGEQKTKIHTDLADGETYSEISQKDRDSVREALGRISKTLEIPGGIDALDSASKASLFNDQELINSILTKASEDSRLICRRERKVGSNRPVTQCATVAQRRKVTEESQDLLRVNQRGNLDPLGL
jgi:hypothetical protein